MRPKIAWEARLKVELAKGQVSDANGEAALALVVSLLDVLVGKTKTPTEGEAGLILTQALGHFPPHSPRAVENETRAIIESLSGAFTAPAKR